MEKRMLVCGVWVMFILISCGACRPKINAEDIKVTPSPRKLIAGVGYFNFDAETRIGTENESAKVISEKFSSYFERVTGTHIPVTNEAEGAPITVKMNTTMPDGAYSLRVSPVKIEIRAFSEAGFVRAFLVLRQLMRGGNAEASSEAMWKVPSVWIEDHPGIMLE
ncbi:hypothetical protein FUAX_07390 [Fulvitalea axinellae]|uniref:Beta-hexosaminidase bacterial type N-terminal domain-containing protein n=1 Tax=Fulvitalea axinellae TaxID=1182444 RepID=A0AAU9CK76_9BACT|nr:hypothetical protein FUAX_07390 [Fulvitalea axinellae]